jgi:hypothetical protein
MVGCRQWLRRIPGIFAGLVLLLLLAGFTYEQMGRGHGGEAPSPTGRAGHRHRWTHAEPLLFGGRQSGCDSRNGRQRARI